MPKSEIPTEKSLFLTVHCQKTPIVDIFTKKIKLKFKHQCNAILTMRKTYFLFKTVRGHEKNRDIETPYIYL